MPTWLKLEHIAEAAVWSLLGVLLFIGLFWLVDRLTPGDSWKDITEKNNTAVAILFGSCAIALGLIISAAIRG